MRRGIMGAAAAWLVLLCCLCPARASGEVFSAQSEALDLEGLVDAAEGVLPDLDLTEGVDLDQGIQYILLASLCSVYAWHTYNHARKTHIHIK